MSPLIFVEHTAGTTACTARTNGQGGDVTLTGFEGVAHGGYVLFDDSSKGAPFDLYPFMLKKAERGEYELVIENPNFLFTRVG